MYRVRKFAKQGVISLTMLFAAAFSVAADKPAIDDPAVLEVGDRAPMFDGDDDQGQKWKSSESVGKKYLVVYFYPADFTTGCTKQAELWRDNMNALADLGVEVIGVSGDSVQNHKLFKDAWSLNFTLLADEEARISKLFGVPGRPGGRVRPRGPDRKPLVDDDGNPLTLVRKATFARWTFVIGKDGKIAYKNVKVNPAKDSQQVLEFIKNSGGREEGALNSIRNLGGQVTLDENDPDRPVIDLRIYGCRGKDEYLVHLADFDKLKKLHIGGDGITDDGLKHLAGLSDLETLIINGSSVNGIGLINIIELRELRTLDLRDSRINDAGLTTLKLLPKLRVLDLSGTSVTDAGLSHLKELKQLESLNLDFTEQELTDKGIEQLQGLTQLETLNLGFSALTDAGLKSLAQLKNLKSLNIEGSNVTDKGRADLHRAIPSIKIRQ
jgi:peroxiredoxin Q/BCP